MNGFVHPPSYSLLRRFFALAVMAGGVTGAIAQPAAFPDSAGDLCVVVGAPGEDQFREPLQRAADAWRQAAERGQLAATLIGTSTDPETSANDRDRLREWLEQRDVGEGAAPLWLVYLGHGTFDGREAHLNLRGPDVSATELAQWLQPVQRPVIFVHGGSSAGPFLPALSGPNRIIVTATRSGHEANYARFGERFAEAIGRLEADIDQDGQVSVLEAFVTAAQQAKAFYEENARLATEHALLDDNGDRQGTPAEWFRGTRVQQRADGDRVPDGERARLLAVVLTEEERTLTADQRARRDALERELSALRARKNELPEAVYAFELETLLRQLGALYQEGT